MSFTNPWIFLILPVYIALELFLFYRLKSRALDIPSAGFLRMRETWRTRAIRFARFLPAAACVLIITLVAGPTRERNTKEVLPSGVDILLTLDVSGSMAAEDFQPHNRLEVAKDVMRDFVRGRTSDRIGLVLFAGRSITRVPLTLQHETVIGAIDNVQLGQVPEGTAIGTAIMSSLNRLRSQTSSGKGDRILLLITDGRNNAGEVHPNDALQIAIEQKIKVYTIAIGSHGKVPFPYYTADGKKGYRYEEADIDEPLLRRIADQTGGQYFRGTDPKSLGALFDNIDALEKSDAQSVESRSVAPVINPVLIPALIIGICYILLTIKVIRLP